MRLSGCISSKLLHVASSATSAVLGGTGPSSEGPTIHVIFISISQWETLLECEYNALLWKFFYPDTILKIQVAGVTGDDSRCDTETRAWTDSQCIQITKQLLPSKWLLNNLGVENCCWRLWFLHEASLCMAIALYEQVCLSLLVPNMTKSLMTKANWPAQTLSLNPFSKTLLVWRILLVSATIRRPA